MKERTESILPRWMRLFIIFVAFIWMVILLLNVTGCMTTYVVEATHPSGQQTRVEVRSFREFEQPEVHYSRDGESVTFDFGATSATTATSPIEQAVAEKIRTTGLLPGGDNE